MPAMEYIILIGSVIILACIAIARFSDNLGVPTVILFLGVGMLAGSEGPGGLYFDDAGLAQSIGIFALVIILFSGGLGTSWRQVKPVALQAASLATAGVLVTAIAVGIFVSALFHLPLMTGLLLGAVVSSTDAAAVFSVLRSKQVNIGGRLRALLELESGSNDPMAVFLTIGLVQFATAPETTAWKLVLLFVTQMGIGAASGLLLGKVMVFFINRLKLPYDGIYSVFTLAFAGLIYGATASAGGSGFLAVYIAGIAAADADFVQKKSLLRFFDGIAWLGQIAMFVTLGLLVFPSQVLPVAGIGLLISVFLMFVARPLSVFLSLARGRMPWREKVFISWVGLRGAVPVILATFPLLAGVPDAGLIFNVVFFIVITSALVQGWSIPVVARTLGLEVPMEAKKRYPIRFLPVAGDDTELVDLIVPYNSAVSGRTIIELGMPPDSLIVLVGRNNGYLVPSGGTVLQESDTVLALVNRNNLPAVRAIFSEQLSPAS
jgi:cell volume regulation protein A